MSKLRKILTDLADKANRDGSNGMFPNDEDINLAEKEILEIAVFNDKEIKS